jgi:hypothetical protein
MTILRDQLPIAEFQIPNQHPQQTCLPTYPRCLRHCAVVVSYRHHRAHNLFIGSTKGSIWGAGCLQEPRHRPHEPDASLMLGHTPSAKGEMPLCGATRWRKWRRKRPEQRRHGPVPWPHFFYTLQFAASLPVRTLLLLTATREGASRPPFALAARANLRLEFKNTRNPKPHTVMAASAKQIVRDHLRLLRSPLVGEVPLRQNARQAATHD